MFFFLFLCFQAEIKKVIDKVCVLLPSTLMKDCLSFMDEYAISLIELLVDSMEPSVACRKMKLCKDTFNAG